MVEIKLFDYLKEKFNYKNDIFIINIMFFSSYLTLISIIVLQLNVKNFPSIYFLSFVLILSTHFYSVYTLQYDTKDLLEKNNILSINNQILKEDKNNVLQSKNKDVIFFLDSMETEIKQIEDYYIRKVYLDLINKMKEALKE